MPAAARQSANVYQCHSPNLAQLQDCTTSVKIAPIQDKIEQPQQLRASSKASPPSITSDNVHYRKSLSFT